MKKLIIQIILIIIVLILIIIGITYLFNKKNEKTELEIEYEKLKEDSTMYDENANIEDLKEEYNIEGDSALYEIQTEYDGRKVLVIKASENFKIAFAGLIKKEIPTYEESTQIFNEQYPTQTGIWVEPESRKQILDYLNNTLKSTYQINEKGYIEVEQYEKSENDEIIRQLISGEKQYIIGISSTTYYIDALTGDIIDNPYEELDYDQTYSYFIDENKMIIYVSENNSGELDNNEIFESIIELVKN